MRFQAALFDLDGTLLDTIEDLADSMNAVLAEEGFPTPPAEQHKFMVGDGVRQYMIRALPQEQRLDEGLIDRLIPKYRQLYAANWHRKTQVYAGIPDMLWGLEERGVRLAVLSNKPDDFTGRMVRQFLGEYNFAVIRGAVDDVPLKPDPAAALAVATDMHLAPAAFVYLGDTATDMQTARAAGMYAVGALWGFRPREELEKAGAQKLIQKPTQLLGLM